MDITGVVKKIIYRNEANGYTILELACEEETVTAVGAMPLSSVGERLSLEGEWGFHRTFGRQFRVDSYQTLAPANELALIHYLGSGLIKGVGEQTAKNIVGAFGMDTIRVLEDQPERLNEVPGIGRQRAETISQSFIAQRDMRDVMMALSGVGVTIGQAVKLYKQYGAMCMARIRENPYSLIDDIEGIGFKIADRIAGNAGIEFDSPFRTQAGIKYVLQQARLDGHTYLPRETLAARAAELLGADILPVERALETLIDARALVNRTLDGEDAVFIPYLYYLEREVARRLLGMVNQPGVPVSFLCVEDQLTLLERENGISLAPMQREAVLSALREGAIVITGGPGTGKTTILKFIIDMLDRMGLDYELSAPTGRAAMRMKEATGREARTIHRMLEYGANGNFFMKNADNPLMADVVIVDEMSMVDVSLMGALIKALVPGTRLIMVGDADQLPPVGPGNVLRDIVKSGTVPVIRLDEIFRQSHRSAIVTNAHRINHGRMPELDELCEDFCFEESSNVDDVIRRVIALCKNGAAGRPCGDIQVLSPMKRGPLGVANLNVQLQAVLNPAGKKKECRFGETLFREGDKVIQNKNNYKMEWIRTDASGLCESGCGVFNGDLGTIEHIDQDEQTIAVVFDDGRAASYDFIQLEELELAYCITVHKSQGSEYPVVILPVVSGPPMLMTRNLLYTAVTRARANVYIIGRRDAIRTMVNQYNEKERFSALCAFLEGAEDLECTEI